jgi:hypothetical protein
MAWRVSVLWLAVAVQVGCGYLQSGTWEDDPGNWRRAFRADKPPQVVVVHSKYWRSPHFTYEFQYFFEIQGDPEFKRELFRRNKLEQVPADKVAEVKRDSFGHLPAWFCPKAPDAYEAWLYEEPPRGNFRVLIDRATGTIYITDYQV